MLLQSIRMAPLNLRIQMTAIRKSVMIVATEIEIATAAETEIESEETAVETDLAGRQMGIKN